MASKKLFFYQEILLYVGIRVVLCYLMASNYNPMVLNLRIPSFIGAFLKVRRWVMLTTNLQPSQYRKKSFKIKSSLQHSQNYTEAWSKLVKSIISQKHRAPFKEMLQRWRTVGKTASNYTSSEMEPITLPEAKALPLHHIKQFQKKLRYSTVVQIQIFVQSRKTIITALPKISKKRKGSSNFFPK